LMASGGRPDFSAISRSCSRMWPCAGSSPFNPPSSSAGHAPVGTLRPILIEDVEKGELAFGVGSRFFGMGGLSSICVPLSKKKTGFLQR
jgi:hypothetical protein